MTEEIYIENNNYDNLIKRFYLFGVEPDDINLSGFDKDYLKEDFLPIKLLSIFPPSETKSIIDNNIIISHCFPSGYKLKESTDDLRNKPEFFYFNLYNLYSTSFNDRNIFFTCCIFYERLSDYLEIINLKKNKKAENDKINPDNIYIPKLICITSFIPYPMQFRTILEKILAYSKKDKIELPLEKVIENIVLGIPSPKKCVFYPIIKSDCCFDSHIDFTLRDLNQYNFYSYKMKTIFVFKIEEVFEIYKSILLEKPILFFSEDKEKLTNIFESFLTIIFPFEYQNPHCAILPDCNAGIVEQAKSFIFGINERWEDPSTDNDKNYFHRLNLNIFKTVLICDIDRGALASYHGYYTAPIMTFNEFHSNAYPNVNPIILTTAKTNNLSNLKPETEKCKIPSKYSGKLKNKLRDKLFHSDSQMNFDYSEKSNEIIIEYFYYFLVSILKNYNDYLYNTKDDILGVNDLFLKKDITTIGIEKMFKSSQYIFREIDKNDDSIFFETLFETDLFKNFIFRKYRNRKYDRYTFLLFDETIVVKKNKNKFSKIKTEFINSKFFGTTVTYEMAKTQNFEKMDYDSMKRRQRELLFNYYQKYDGENLSYCLFPKLLYDDKFFKRPNGWKYLFNEEKLNTIYMVYESNKKRIDPKLYFKIYEGDLIKRFKFNQNDHTFKNEMSNIIEYLWLTTFCLTFYYCQDMEKKIRYQELIKNLKHLEIPYSHNKIINYLYMTLIKYGNYYMIINFYDFLNLNDYDLYNNFCNIMRYNENDLAENKIKKDNLILKKLDVANTKLSLCYFKDKDEDENDVNSKSLKVSLTINQENTFDKQNILPKRSFNDDETNDEKESIIFNNKLTCPNCNKELDISILAGEINNMPKQKEITCNKCKNSFTPVNCIRVGSYSKNIKIYNPYYLYHEIGLKILKKYGTKIDIDVLREEYSDFYWNCILYFYLHGYSYDMLIKYKENKKENKKDNTGTSKKDNKERQKKMSLQSVNGFYNLSIQNQNINFKS